MAELKYIVTVDSETGAPIKLHLLGDSGELTEMDLSELSWDSGNTGGISVVVNIYGGASVNPKSEVRVPERGIQKCRFPSPPPVPRPK